MIGLGFQEIITFSMTDKDTLFNKMNLKESISVDISNPMISRLHYLEKMAPSKPYGIFKQ